MRSFLKGNHALATSALNAGCRAYFGYPITPQNEIIEYLREHMPDDGVCIQAESELASINMVFAAAAIGVRAMTSSSGPGIPLMQEGISAIASAELPAVIVNVMRNGSGGGNILPGQGDYFSAVKGGGNGDYRTVVLAPNSVQEMYDLTAVAFNLADEFRNPVMILADGAVAQMSEFCEIKTVPIVATDKSWALKGRRPEADEGAAGKSIITWHWTKEESRDFQFKLKHKYEAITAAHTMVEEYMVEDAEVVCVCFGIISRLTKSAVEGLRGRGVRCGMIRPITLFPFPEAALRKLNPGQTILVIEQNNGQMLEDVQRLCRGMPNTIEFMGGGGGILPGSDMIADRIEAVYPSACMKESVHD